MAKTSYYTVDGQILGERTGGTRRNYGVDALGSVTSTIQASAIENSYTYKPYGKLLQKTGTGTDPIFIWVGTKGYKTTGRTHAETYVRARIYSSLLNRWSTVDPAWPVQHAYEYCSGRPTTLIDPAGYFDYEKWFTCSNIKGSCFIWHTIHLAAWLEFNLMLNSRCEAGCLLLGPAAEACIAACNLTLELENAVALGYYLNGVAMCGVKYYWCLYLNKRESEGDKVENDSFVRIQAWVKDNF